MLVRWQAHLLSSLAHAPSTAANRGQTMPPFRKVVLAAGLMAAVLATSLPAFPRIAEGTTSLQPGATKLETAFEALKKAHEAGDRRATVAYVTMLQRGLGTAADPQRAFALAKGAADAGDTEAAV